MQGEVWKTIPSLPEYEASDWGRVRRKPHLKPRKGGGLYRVAGKPTKGVLRPSSGGPRYSIRCSGRNYKVARLVCEAFHGPPPPGKPNCLHRDEDAQNNRPGNLKWGTQRENLNAPGFLDYCRSRKTTRKTGPKGWRRKP